MKGIPETPRYLRLYYYHLCWWTIVLKCIICPVISASVNLQVLSKVIYDNLGQSPRDTYNLCLFWLSCWDPLTYLLSKTLNHLAFQPFDYKCIWRMLLEKRVRDTTINIYVFIGLEWLIVKLENISPWTPSSYILPITSMKRRFKKWNYISFAAHAWNS